MSLWWILGLACVGLVVLAFIGLVILMIIDKKRSNRVLSQGEHTTGWLVQANTALFEKGVVDMPALVLISPDRETLDDEEFLAGLAGRVMDLKGVNPGDCDDDDEAFVAALLSDETYVEGKRDRLPKSFTEGRKVYLAHLFVYRDHLPGQRLGRRRRLDCAVLWDDPKAPICTRPWARKRRHEDEDDDD